MDKAILIGLDLGHYPMDESLEELQNLANALNIEVVEKMSQRAVRPNIKTYIGSGKVSELKQAIDILEADMVIFDDELTPAQIRNLEKELDTQIVDRSFLILSIFAERAKTKTSFIEVSLAQQKYILPRLVGMRSSLSRQGGGTYNAKGPGETKLELDRRVIIRNISKLERSLRQIEIQQTTARKKRHINEIPIVSLVGYTNAGKTATLNALAKYLNLKREPLFEKDMLFATLDTTARKITNKGYPSFILTDTIGFVSRLPHAFINSFKSTLNEVIYSDLILHVIDGTIKEKSLYEKTTLNVLKELDAKEIPIVKLYTRLDLISHDDDHSNGLFISNRSFANFDRLLKNIYKSLFGKEHTINLLIPYHRQHLINELNLHTRVVSVDYLEHGILVQTQLFEKQIEVYKAYLPSINGLKN